MPLVQGNWPKTKWSKVMVGEDDNGRFTTNVQEYRGRPYCKAAAIHMDEIDQQREVVKVTQQRGLRQVAIIMTTGTITPAH